MKNEKIVVFVHLLFERKLMLDNRYSIRMNPTYRPNYAPAESWYESVMVCYQCQLYLHRRFDSLSIYEPHQIADYVRFYTYHRDA